MRSWQRQIVAGVVCVLVLLPLFGGCGNQKEKEAVTEIPVENDTFTKKLDWLIPESFKSLEYACENKADQEIDAAINLKTYVPADRFFLMFKDIEVEFRNIYYGIDSFSGIYPVDPRLASDSTMTLMQIEARSLLGMQIRQMMEQISNITDETLRGQAEGKLQEMRNVDLKIEQYGVLIYGAEMRAFPRDLKNLMFHPDGLIRVIFPGVPRTDSWVRLSPYSIERKLELDKSLTQ